MTVITPTITTADPHEFREQMELIATYAEGVHLDFSDGEFSPVNMLPLDKAWRSDELITHAHIMYADPLSVIEDIMHLEADLVILHAESEKVKEALQLLQENGTRTGVALLAETSLADLQELEIDGLFDHILVFGGHLGYQGGQADTSLLTKVAQLKAVYPDAEFGWDGGLNAENIRAISEAGVDILNVGSYLKNAEDPKKAYAELAEIIE